MYLKGIILSLGVLCLIAGARSKPRCAFSIPALLKSGETGCACYNIRNPEGPAIVDMTLEVSGENHTVISDKIPAGNHFKCPTFQVPTILAAAPVFFTVSVVATDFAYTERRAVILTPTGHVTFIQFDKPIYKARQKVRFNLVSVDNNLKPVKEEYSFIYILDPSGNRLYQWKNQETTNGFLALAFDIVDEPEFGTYQLQTVTWSGQLTLKPFSVDEYVLPNIELKVTSDETMTIMNQTLTFTATAKYTYGLPVPGKVSVRACRPPTNYYANNACNRNPEGLCSSVTGELDSEGTFNGNLDMTPLQLDRSGYNMGLNMHVTVTEEGSGIQTTESKYIGITNLMGQVTFNRKNMDQYYRKGMNYSMEATVVDGLGKPVRNQTIEMRVNGEAVKNLTSDENGKVQDYIDTTKWEQSSVNIQVNYRNSEQCYDSTYVVPIYSNDYYSVTRFYSRSGCFVQLEKPEEEFQCGQTYNLRAKYIFSQPGLQDNETSVDFNYMMMSRSTIQKSGTVTADLTKSMQGEVDVSIEMSEILVPVLDVVIYCLLKDEVVAHTMRLNTEKCFSNQVSLNFSEETAKPGSTVNLNIESEPGSVCAVRVYDSSLLLISNQQSLTPDEVYAALQYNSLDGFYEAGYNVEPPRPDCTDPNKQVLIDGSYYSLVAFPNEGDASRQFSSVGMHMITSARLSQPTLCGQPSFGRPPIWHDGLMSNNVLAFARQPGLEAEFTSPVSDSPSAPAEIGSVRKSFPEVWLFALTPAINSGSHSVSLEVPGTITQWKGDMVCLESKKGFGMTKYPANFTSFQDFFVSASLPSSIIRGEILIVRPVVSNYMDKSAKINVMVAPSDDYTIEPMDDNSIQCVPSGGRASFSFRLEAKSLGPISLSITAAAETGGGDTCDGPTKGNEPNRKDTIVQSIIVEPEGIRQEATKSTLICTNDTDIETVVNISPPENSVKGATTVTISVIGDILGHALDSTDSMFNGPTGSGEQSVASLMATALVTRFRNVTHRLTEDEKRKAVLLMEMGYMRQMPYRNYDGSFGLFPNRESNSWVTLKTLHSMELLNEFIDVDDRIPNQGMVWLENQRDKSTGAFKANGPMLNNALKGSTEDDDVSFTAQVLIYLLQTNYASTPSLLRQSLNYLVAASQREQSVYIKALLFCVFRMAGNEKLANAMFADLQKVQIEEGGTLHWMGLNTQSHPRPSMFSPQATSADVEITSYVLFGLVFGPSPPMVDLGYMSKVAVWLAQQQNSQGSYITTADTVAALQALCAYAPLVYQKDATNTVDVKFEDVVVKLFNLNPENRDLPQTETLPDKAGDYKITVSGKGCVLVQTTVKYNVPVKEENSAFQVSVSTTPESCVDGVAYTFPVNMNISFNSPRNESNLALVKFPMPSGYRLAEQSHNELQQKPEVGKVLQKNNCVYIYLKKVNSKPIYLTLVLQMGQLVQNLQPKPVYVSDCYEKGDNGLAVVYHPCSSL